MEFSFVSISYKKNKYWIIFQVMKKYLLVILVLSKNWHEICLKKWLTTEFYKLTMIYQKHFIKIFNIKF